MGKKNEREFFDIDLISNNIQKNSIQMEPDEYNDIKMPIYSSNVNLRRQIPEIRDGLIPLQRRILTTLYFMKLYKGNISKSVHIIGMVMRWYHPHGDSSIYNGMVCMSQPFRNNVKFINGKGNFGTACDMDSAANQRYTECTMSEFAYDCFFSDWGLTSAENDMVVDWMPNYDDSRLEPMYLPAKYPTFLINWRREPYCVAY